jgi:hypothetical protein
MTEKLRVLAVKIHVMTEKLRAAVISCSSMVSERGEM